MIGPAPMMRMEEMSVRLGIIRPLIYKDRRRRRLFVKRWSMHCPCPGFATPAVIFDPAKDFDLETLFRQRTDGRFVDRLLGFEKQVEIAFLILFAVEFDKAELAGDGQHPFEILLAPTEADIDG